MTLQKRSLAMATVAVACLALGATHTLAEQVVGYVVNTFNSEDMVLIPDTNWVVASSDATPGKTKPGYLYSVDTVTGVAQLVDSEIAPASSTGDPSCKPVRLSDLATSGLALRNRRNGTHQLMVVNHGDRMSIEFFDINALGSSPIFTWTGCVVMPEKAFPNSVVPIGDDGMAVTISFETDNTHFTDQLDRRENTGYLLEWSRQTGFNKVPGSELSMNNGLQVDADGNYYIAAWGSQQLLRLPKFKGNVKPLLVDIGIRPDNITWTPRGTLLVAGHSQAPKEVFACVATDAEVCAVPFKIIEVDPRTMSIIRTVVDDGSTKTFAAATTGLEVGDEIWASSFRSTKIARYRKE